MTEQEAKLKAEAQAQFCKEVNDVLSELREMLFAKNRKYGNAALNPKRTFARSSAVELINVRIDDKLSRIANRQGDEDEDPEWDMMGYLVLKRIAQMREKQQDHLVSQHNADILNGEIQPSMRGNVFSEDCPRGCTGIDPHLCQRNGCQKRKIVAR